MRIRRTQSQIIADTRKSHCANNHVDTCRCYLDRQTAYDALNGKRHRTIKSIYALNSEYLLALLPTFEYPNWDYRTVDEFLRYIDSLQVADVRQWAKNKLK